MSIAPYDPVLALLEIDNRAISRLSWVTFLVIEIGARTKAKKGGTIAEAF
jgi:hypothetical protein